MRTAAPILAALVLTTLLQFLINGIEPTTYLFRLFRPPGGWVMSLGAPLARAQQDVIAARGDHMLAKLLQDLGGAGGAFTGR